jgi:hypothetical protein
MLSLGFKSMEVFGILERAIQIKSYEKQYKRGKEKIFAAFGE